MSDLPSILIQNIFKAPHRPILVTTCACISLTRRILEDFLDTADDGVIGVAPAYGPNCVLSVLAFASVSKILLVHLPKRKPKAKYPSTEGKDLLEELILRTDSQKIAFHMDVLASALFTDLGLRLCGAVDLLSVAKDSRNSLEARMDSIGGIANLNKREVVLLFKGDEKLKQTQLKDVALQAWVAWRAATLDHMAARLKKVPRIDTSALPESRLSVFAKMVRDASRLEALKPTWVKNEIDSEYKFEKGRLQVASSRFKTRIGPKGDQRLEIHGMNQGQQRMTVSCQTTRVDGRTAHINLKSALPTGKFKVVTVGKDPLTSAEVQRADIILKALQRISPIVAKPFFRAIWLPQEPPTWPPGLPFIYTIPIHFPSRPLNDSQKKAVAAILSNKEINVIHGPPGTGKTTVIAAAVTSIHAAARDRTVWLVAQSNVAVKNIAEKLASTNFLDFKLLVSRDFHYDWHEHLYEKINPNLIRSDELVDDIVATERQLLGSRVILCTLTMLSNPRISPITRLVPLQMVIVDEASQVEIGNYLPMINLFSKSLRKLVFIGDDKQLAPYGQGDIDSLQSIFEMEHLRKDAIFLNTQYRMPTQLGAFIGRHVYDNKLKTVHPDKAPCCRFIDVKKSKEMSKGSSWINMAEISAAIAEARKCNARNHSYRIITPYDAQRGMLEAALKASKLPWEDKVFCVDSFQGNEDDWIILSIVRTEKIGFLAEQRRVNVMLSRCKKGMKICTSRAFVEGKARESLVGLLASEIGPAAWVG